MKGAIRTIPRSVHSSAAVRAGPLVFTSGFLGVSPGTGQLVRKFSDLDDDGKAFATGMLSVDGWVEGIGAQFWQASKNVKAALESEGSSLGELVLLNFYSMQMHHHHLINALRSKVFLPANTPPNTGMQVAGNPAGALMQAAAIGFAANGSKWQRRLIKESSVSQAMSAYDLGVHVGPFLITGDFVPGSKKLQRAIETYEDVPSLSESLRPPDLVRGSREETVRAQAWFLFENIRDVLKENDAKLEDVVKLRVYLVDMADAASYAEIHAAFFGSHRPVVTFGTAVKLGRPEFRVAIEVTAVPPKLLPDPRYKPRFLTDESSRRVFGDGSDGVAVGPYILLGNSARSAPKAGAGAGFEELPDLGLRRGESVGTEFVFGPAMVEAWRALQNGDRLLKSAGASIRDAVSLSVYLLSISDLPAVDRVLRHVFPAKPPAVTVIQAPQMPVRGSSVEIEITAYKE